MLLQRQHFLLLYLKNLSVGPAGVSTTTSLIVTGRPQRNGYKESEKFSSNIYHKLDHRQLFIWIKDHLKGACSSFFGLRVEDLKLKSRMQDKLGSSLYYISISKYDQNLFSHRFPSNSYYNSNGSTYPSF